MSPKLQMLNPTRNWLEARAEEFLGPELRDTFVVRHGCHSTIEPGTEATLFFTLTAAGVPAHLLQVPTGVSITRMSAGATPIWPSHTEEEPKVRGCPCVDGEIVMVVLRNESTEKRSIEGISLVCAAPPELGIDQGDPHADCQDEVWLDLSERMGVFVLLKRHQRPPPLLRGIVTLDLKALPPRKCDRCGALFERDREVACEVIAPREGFLAPLALVLPEDGSESYDVTMIGMGESPVVKFRRPVSSVLFGLGRKDRPPLPFFALPPRQSFTVEGLKIDRRKAPPFTGKLICARIEDPWERAKPKSEEQGK